MLYQITLLKNGTHVDMFAAMKDMIEFAEENNAAVYFHSSDEGYRTDTLTTTVFRFDLYPRDVGLFKADSNNRHLIEASI